MLLDHCFRRFEGDAEGFGGVDGVSCEIVHPWIINLRARKGVPALMDSISCFV